LSSRARISLSLLIARPPLRFHHAPSSLRQLASRLHSIASSSCVPDNVLSVPLADWRHSNFMFAARITLPRFSVSAAMSLPKSVAEPTSAVLPKPASRALIL
jgi:hypothetical protein